MFSFLVLSSCNKSKSKNNQQIDPKVSKVEVIDFHSTHRCKTCRAIETNTKYTLKMYFPKELKDKKVTFRKISVEKNKEMAEKFEATGTALFLNIISNGKEEQIDLTNFAFLKGKDKDVFSEELKNKIEEALKKL